jgi:hypothetical protein
MGQKFFDDLAVRAGTAKDSLLLRYERWLLTFLPFRRLVRYLHERLNRVQYDPVNPQNRTAENPEGYQTPDELALARSIEEDKNLLDKVETYFRLRPVSTSLLAFFVISVAATSARNNPTKMAIVVTIILAILPLILSRQSQVRDELILTHEDIHP